MMKLIINSIIILFNCYVVSSTAFVPAGFVLAYAGSTAPNGWLICDGSLLKRVDYPKLFGAISTNHGTTTASDFRIPDYRGRFLRGWTDRSTSTRDPIGRSDMNPGGVTSGIGSVQTSGSSSPNNAFTFSITYDKLTHEHVKAISTTDTTCGVQVNPATRFFSHSTGPSYVTALNLNTGSADKLHYHHFSSTSSGNAESAPPNVYVNYIIKY